MKKSVEILSWKKVRFFFIPVVQEYLNEISPTLNGPNKLKTSGKPLKIVDLQPPSSGQDKPDTLYIIIYFAQFFEESKQFFTS